MAFIAAALKYNLLLSIESARNPRYCVTLTRATKPGPQGQGTLASAIFLHKLTANGPKWQSDAALIRHHSGPTIGRMFSQMRCNGFCDCSREENWPSHQSSNMGPARKASVTATTNTIPTLTLFLSCFCFVFVILYLFPKLTCYPCLPRKPAKQKLALPPNDKTKGCVIG